MQNEVLTSQEAADLFRISVPTIREMAVTGKIPATKFGDDWRFIRSQLLNYMQERAISEQRRRQEQQTVIELQPKPKRKRGRPENQLVDLSKYQGAM